MDTWFSEKANVQERKTPPEIKLRRVHAFTVEFEIRVFQITPCGSVGFTDVCFLNILQALCLTWKSLIISFL